MFGTKLERRHVVLILVEAWFILTASVCSNAASPKQKPKHTPAKPALKVCQTCDDVKKNAIVDPKIQATGQVTGPFTIADADKKLGLSILVPPHVPVGAVFSGVRISIINPGPSAVDAPPSPPRTDFGVIVSTGPATPGLQTLVMPCSPADTAGVDSGLTILEIDGVPVTGMDFKSAAAIRDAHDVMSIKVQDHDGKISTFSGLARSTYTPCDQTWLPPGAIIVPQILLDYRLNGKVFTVGEQPTNYPRHSVAPMADLVRVVGRDPRGPFKSWTQTVVSPTLTIITPDANTMLTHPSMTLMWLNGGWACELQDPQSALSPTQAMGLARP